MNIILVKQKIIAIRSLLIIHFCLLISGGIYLIIIYSAIRAMYGASFVITSVLLWTLLNFYRSSLKRKIILFPLALIIFTFSLHQMLILSTKSANAKVIDTKIKELKKKMADCNEPCIIELGDLKEGLIRDWVLHEDYYQGFALWQKNQHFPQKNIKFNLGHL